MFKKISLLMIVTFFSNICEANENVNQEDFTRQDTVYSYENEGDFDNEIAARNKKSRREGRSDFYQNRSSAFQENPAIENAPGVGADDYWKKNSRQEYLRGRDSKSSPSKWDGVEPGQNDRVPTSNPRWYKEKSGRREYLKGGSDYMKR